MSDGARQVATKGFTLVEVLISMTVLSLGMVALGALLVRSARQATAASSVVYQTAALSEEVGRMGAMPFALLVAGNTCVTVTAHPLPHTRCTTITDVTAKRKTVKIKITPTGNPLLSADSTMFERSVSNTGTPLNTP
ncbi:MAG TPA: prepilin-type N-terminal cleavage/methylation domain-containing protein [Gemmatimonadales bacterium]|nr:prepilin-type N-terminal cleavage/methylation domain-containing protein [Gemmatimonadales bacterium]